MNGPKPCRRERVGREADDGGGAAVEVAGGHDDVRLAGRHALDVVAPLAGDLDRGLDRLGAGVHRQHPVLAGQLRQVAAERAELVVVEGPAGQRHPVELVARRLRAARGAGARSSARSSRPGSRGSGGRRRRSPRRPRPRRPPPAAGRSSAPRSGPRGGGAPRSGGVVRPTVVIVRPAAGLGGGRPDPLPRLRRGAPAAGTGRRPGPRPPLLVDELGEQLLGVAEQHRPGQDLRRLVEGS